MSAIVFSYALYYIIRAFVVFVFVFVEGFVIHRLGSKATRSRFLYLLVVLARLSLIAPLGVSTSQNYISIIFDTGIY